MPNQQHDPRYGENQHSQRQSSGPQRSSGPNPAGPPTPPRQPSPPPVPGKPFRPAQKRARDNRPQEPIVPKGQDDENVPPLQPRHQAQPRYQTPDPTENSYGSSHARMRAIRTTPGDAVPSTPSAEQYQVTDYILFGILGALFLGIIIIVIYLLTAGKPLSLDFEKLKGLFLYFLIYVGCVVAGYLWGRHQSNTVATKENIMLKEQIHQLQGKNASLKTQQAALQQQAAGSTPPVVAASSGVFKNPPAPLPKAIRSRAASTLSL